MGRTISTDSRIGRENFAYPESIRSFYHALIIYSRNPKSAEDYVLVRISDRLLVCVQEMG
jgi:hypothetical protein